MIEKIEAISAEELARFCAQTAEDRKAEDVMVLKMSEVSFISDYFVICTGTSQPHLKAICEWIRRKVRESYSSRPIAIDGEGTEWVILDFGNVMVHILSLESRARYQLENLWGDAQRLEKLVAEKKGMQS